LRGRTFQRRMPIARMLHRRYYRHRNQKPPGRRSRLASRLMYHSSKPGFGVGVDDCTSGMSHGVLHGISHGISHDMGFHMGFYMGFHMGFHMTWDFTWGFTWDFTWNFTCHSNDQKPLQFSRNFYVGRNSSDTILV
jgi:hypothetical protein